jgi:hypothetical protein
MIEVAIKELAHDGVSELYLTAAVVAVRLGRRCGRSIFLRGA